MEGEELRKGKERVRQLLIEPLEGQGMKRKRTVTVEDHARFLGSICARLAYMTEGNLQALAEVVARYADGPRKDVWPSELTIINNATRLQTPPASQSRLVRTYLQSAAGDAAERGGYLVELFAHLKRFGAPPNSYALETIRREADGNARQVEAVTHAREEGRASPSDLRWLQDYMAARGLCLDIRAAKVREDAV